MNKKLTIVIQMHDGYVDGVATNMGDDFNILVVEHDSGNCEEVVNVYGDCAERSDDPKQFINYAMTRIVRQMNEYKDDADQAELIADLEKAIDRLNYFGMEIK